MGGAGRAMCDVARQLRIEGSGIVVQQHQQFVADNTRHDDTAALDAALPAQTVGWLKGVKHIAPLL